MHEGLGPLVALLESVGLPLVPVSILSFFCWRFWVRLLEKDKEISEMHQACLRCHSGQEQQTKSVIETLSDIIRAAVAVPEDH